MDPSKSSSFRQVAVPIIVGLAGGMVFVLAPLFVAALRSGRFGLSETQVGLIGSADPAGLFLGAALGLTAIHRFDHRKLAMSVLALVIAANLLSILAVQHSFFALAMCRLLAGAAGGLALAVAYACFSKTPLPDRTFALYLVAQTITGALAITGLAHWVPQGSAASIFAIAATLSGIGVVGAWWLEGSVPIRTSRTRAVRAPIGLILLTVFSELLVAAACLGIWANFSAFGKSLGLTSEEMAVGLTAGLFGGGLGSLAVAVTGLRFGRLVPAALLMTFLIGSTAALATHLSAFEFAVVAFLFQLGINASTYVFGAVSVASADGRLPVYYLLSLKAGFALGPWAGSQILQANGLPGLVWGATIALLGVAILFASILLFFTPRIDFKQVSYP